MFLTATKIDFCKIIKKRLRYLNFCKMSTMESSGVAKRCKTVQKCLGPTFFELFEFWNFAVSKKQLSLQPQRRILEFITNSRKSSKLQKTWPLSVLGPFLNAKILKFWTFENLKSQKWSKRAWGTSTFGKWASWKLLRRKTVHKCLAPTPHRFFRYSKFRSFKKAALAAATAPNFGVGWSKSENDRKVLRGHA